MDFQAQQKKFDDIKWFDSIIAGEDRCGTYDFCGVCNKEETYPCARAAYKVRKVAVRVAKLPIRFELVK